MSPSSLQKKKEGGSCCRTGRISNIGDLWNIILFMLILGTVINGYKKGFSKKIIKFVNILMSIVGWPILHPIVKYIMSMTNVSSHLDIVNRIILEAVKNTIGSAKINSTNIATTIEAKSIQALTNLEVKVISFFVTMLIMYVIIKIVVKCTNIISKITFAENLDHILGGAISLIECLIVIWGVLAVIYVISTITDLTLITDEINSVMLLHYLSKMNPIIYILH